MTKRKQHQRPEKSAGHKRSAIARLHQPGGHDGAPKVEFRWEVLQKRKRKRAAIRSGILLGATLLALVILGVFRQPITRTLQWWSLTAGERPAVIAKAGALYPAELRMDKHVYDALMELNERTDLNQVMAVRIKRWKWWLFCKNIDHLSSLTTAEEQLAEAIRKEIKRVHLLPAVGAMIRVADSEGKLIDGLFESLDGQAVRMTAEEKRLAIPFHRLSVEDRLLYDPSYRELWTTLLSRAYALRGHALYLNGPLDEALTAERRLSLANTGHATAQQQMGAAYAKGTGDTADLALAYVYYRAAALQGDAEAQYALGRMVHQGQGVRRDTREAAFWFMQAADQGLSKIMQYLRAFGDADGGFTALTEHARKNWLKQRAHIIERLDALRQGEDVDFAPLYAHPF